MKIYNDTINSISKTQTLASHIKSLGKLELSTEDDQLQKLLRKCIVAMQYKYNKSKPYPFPKSLPVSLVKINEHDIINLLNYCNSIVPKKIPEWQIIAKRHGWGPIK